MGSGPGRWSLAETFVTGRNVDWSALASTLVSSWVFATFAGLVMVLEAAFSLPRRAIAFSYGWMARLIEFPLIEMAADLELSWQVAFESLPVIGGPFTFIIAMGLTAATILAAFWVFDTALKIVGYYR